MSDHGRVIPLNTISDPFRHVEIFAAYANDEPDASVDSETESQLKWMRKRSEDDSLVVLQKKTMTIDGLPAKRLVVRYRSKKSPHIMIEDVIVTIRHGVLFLLHLTTNAAAYQRDRRTFQRIVASFRVRKSG